MADAEFKIVTDNKDEIVDGVNQAIQAALEGIGIKAEKYAKNLCPVGTVESTGIKGYRGGTLRNSITHEVDGGMVAIGSNVEYAPYVELGTGPYFEPPPSWETFESTKGSGIGHGYVHARPFLRPAIEDHLETYKNIIKSQLSDG
jgi:phage gpG-like protein